MGEVIPASISIKGGMLNPDVDGFLWSLQSHALPVHYAEVFHGGKMASGGLVALCW